MLKKILTSEVIATDGKAQDWRQAVKCCGELLVAAGKIEADFITSMIEVVEEFGPYMILVPEVAFFHGRPGPLVKEPCLSLVTLSEPVFFTDFANQKISCAFGFGATDNNSHLRLLKGVSQLLQNEEFLALITHNGSKADIMEIINNMQEEDYETN